MGCDYYIHEYLEIEHINGISYVELPLKRGDYPELECGIYDSDEEECNRYYNLPEFRKIQETVIKLCLLPRKPILIYENHEFVSKKMEEKYKTIIDKKMKHPNDDDDEMCLKYTDTGIFTSMLEVIKITKKDYKQSLIIFHWLILCYLLIL